ncbi:xylulose kinase [Peptococcaceae bacterium CEB3]|nr:xylulose kinase [Peptococcaceae bacterium CEB3]
MLIGLDVGTSGVKVVVFDERGHLLSRSYRAYYSSPPAGDGRRELDPNNIWDCTKDALFQAVSRLERKPDSCSLSVSSFGEAFIPVDDSGNALTKVMLLTDGRGTVEFDRALMGLSAERIAQTCGLKPHPSYSVAKLLYLKANYPVIYNKAKHLLLIEDYIYFKLGGIAYTDYSLAARTMLFDVNSKEWCPEFLEYFGIEAPKLSRPVASGTVIGEVFPGITAKLGLPAKTIIVSGGHDQPCSALGAAVSRNTVVCSMGTSECLTPILSTPLSTEKVLAYGFANEPFLSTDLYCTLAYNTTAGSLIKWFYRAFAKDLAETPDSSYDIIEREAPESPTNLFVLPYLMATGTPLLDSKARLSIMGVDEKTTRGDIYKACLEGLCFDQRLNLELLGDNCECDAIVAVGGGSHSQLWLQTKADVLQKPIITLECDEAGALGCAILSATALGLYPDVFTAAKSMVRIKKITYPNLKFRNQYEDMFRVYKHLHHDCERVNNFVAGKLLESKG